MIGSTTYEGWSAVWTVQRMGPSRAVRHKQVQVEASDAAAPAFTLVTTYNVTMDAV
jgi:hypothetical protein